MNAKTRCRNNVPERAVLDRLGYDENPAPLVYGGGGIRILRFGKVDDRANDMMTIDLLLADGDALPAWPSRRFMEWDGRRMTVLSPGGLIILKSLRNSGMDQDDIAYLRSIDDEH